MTVTVTANASFPLANVSDLLSYLEVESLDEASGVVSEETDADFDLRQDGEALEIQAGMQSLKLPFPFTAEGFWQTVRELGGEVEVAYEQEFTGAGREALAWDAPELFPANEPARVARYRRLQSKYRSQVLRAKPGAFGRYSALGSYLDPTEVAANPRLNFLSDAALAHAEERIVEVREEGGTLDPARLMRNMLSSMPLCFNLFGTMRDEPDFLAVFQLLFDSSATRIGRIVCEWAPQPTAQHLDDRTAFDAVVFYETSDGPRFCGIETKYTEPFSATEYDNENYARVTRESGWFANPDQALANLKARRSNQLWRNVLLAAAVEGHRKYGSGWVAVVALADDPGAAAAIAKVQPELRDKSRLKAISIEAILDAGDSQPSLAPWAADFRARYVGPLTSES